MVTKLNLFLVSLVLSLYAFDSNAQTSAADFEGEIVYTNSFKSKNPQMKEQTLAVMLGKEHHYYIKDGNYKTVMNGMFAQWQLFINKDNKLYNKMASSDTVFWNDAALHDDELLSAALNKDAITVLGYVCDELILTCRSGVHKYYFNSQLQVNAQLFINHQYGNYYNYISRSNAVPLKMILEDNEFTLESEATKVIPKKLSIDFFQLPANTKTAPSLY
ncbi:hypothetical protein [Aurantibacillus circumpalustris]|uniref:hypothetical protein n=1 Tax=Aurantibacillus circumpalustris TaxID=3036359 RepID=UPI00295BCC65|nr:hypothetical protein [Aurantibacillus circumpalustris]